MKKIYFDVETTGINPVKNDIIQIAGIIEIDDKVVDEFNFFAQPFDYDAIDPRALAINKKTIDDLKKYPEPQTTYRDLIGLFNQHVDKFNKHDKFLVYGYNVRFDIDFLNNFFIKNNDNFLFSYFGPACDPFMIAQFLYSIGKIEKTPNFKLGTMCDYFKIELGDAAHDAMADIIATKKLAELFNKKMQKI